MAVNSLDVKLEEVADKFKVDKYDLANLVKFRRFVRMKVPPDILYPRMNIKHVTDDLRSAAVEIEEFIEEWNNKKS